MDSRELALLQATVKCPSNNFLVEKAKDSGHVVVSLEEYEGLKEQSERSVESLASEKGFVLLEATEHESLLSKLEEAQKIPVAK